MCSSVNEVRDPGLCRPRARQGGATTCSEVHPHALQQAQPQPRSQVAMLNRLSSTTNVLATHPYRQPMKSVRDCTWGTWFCGNTSNKMQLQ